MMSDNSDDDLNEKLSDLECLKDALDQHSIVSITDAKGNITYVNDKFCDISGYSREELMGQNHSMVRSDEHSPEFYNDLWKKITSGKTWHGEIKNQKKGGGYYWVAASIIPYLNKQGKPFQYISIRTDISDRKQVEVKLRCAYDELEDRVKERTANLVLSEQRMREYSKTVSDWFWETDQDHRFSFFSDVDADRFPLDTERALGKTRWEVGNADIHDEKWRRHKADLDSHMPFRNFRYKAVGGNGEYAWFNISGRPVFDGDGNFEAYRGTASNITEYVKLEERSQQHLKMEALGTLAGGIAHDLNNTLVPIIGLTELVFDELPENSQEQVNLSHTLKAATHARELVAQILAFSRQEEKTSSRIDLAGELHDILHLLKSTIPSTINVTEDINAVGAIYADRTQVDQVVMNLISNAVHAMEEKGELSIRLDLVEVDDRILESHPQLELGSYARISIKDSGPGISQDDLDRIFDPFFTTKGVGEGTGLGLSVVYGIVSDYKGTITVSSHPGEGTTFHVYLPITADEEDTDPPQ